MTDCEGDGSVALTPLELYEKLSAQGDKVRTLKTEKADKVSGWKAIVNVTHVVHLDLLNVQGDIHIAMCAITTKLVNYYKYTQKNR